VTAPDNAAADRITTAIAAAIQAVELGETGVGMVGSWVLIGSYADGDGDDRIVLLTATDQGLRETLGLLDTGQIAYREQMRRWVHE
jgi:hypothetical protein